MRDIRVKKIGFLCGFFLICLVMAGGSKTAVFAETTGGTIPEVLVNQGVTSYALAYPRVVWHTESDCSVPPALAGSQTPDAPEDPELIRRIPAYGGLERLLFERNQTRPPGACNPYHIYSNVVADQSYVYWATDGGLARLPVAANPLFTAPELVNAAIQSQANAQQVELADGGNYLYAIVYPTATTSQVWRVDKSTFAVLSVSNFTGQATNLSTADQFIYWRVNGTLRQAYQIFFGFSVSSIASGVTGYYAEGERTICLITCTTSDYVFIAQGRQIVRYNNDSGVTSAPIYTSTHPVDPTVVYDLVSDSVYLFILEERTIDCPGCFDTVDTAVLRMTRSGNVVSLLYNHPSDFNITPDSFNLTAYGDTIYWQENDRVLKLPKNAEALPLINLSIARIEITQGIQSIGNAVPIIDNRRTFVRVFAQAAGEDVSGVTAWLYRVHPATNAIIAGPLLPVNNTGAYLTVLPQVTPALEDGSFLFELPLEWLQTGLPSKLMVKLNPSNTPVEPDLSDNTAYSSIFTPVPSPRLRLHVYAVTYNLGNLTIAPRPDKDIQQTFSWLRRAYPLASVSEQYSDPGLQPLVDFISVPGIVSRINQSHPDCEGLGSTCATVYLKDILHAWQDSVDNPSIYLGMIPDDAGFARGKGGGGVAVGPSGVTCCGATFDTDGAYTDWYAGHEIGHALGRKHPVPGSSTCGHSDDDDDYPWNYAAIGPYFGSGVEIGINWGFDVGSPYFGIPRAVYPSAIWRDVMSYCDFQWISDYTYEELYGAIFDWDSGRAASRAFVEAGSGDFLSLYGSLLPTQQKALLPYVRRHDGGVAVPPVVPGDYAIRLLDANGNTLAQTAFTPDSDEEGDEVLSFGQVVDFVAGTRRVQIVEVATNSIWGEEVVSAAAPVVSNVVVDGASPITGTVMVHWTAVDADGDPLAFDLSVSQDSGVTFEPLALGVAGSSFALDSTLLGGGSTILRVTASDGVLAGTADSPPFTIAPKPPQPVILNPGNGAHVEWGQLVQLVGEAWDRQDGLVNAANLVWQNQYGELGTGAALALTDLPVGENVITLTATNSAGLSASTTITVVVEDDLLLPSRTLAVGPTQVGWHIGAGDGEQTAVLQIVNVGSSSFNWTATTPAGWLTLAVTQSSTPGKLTLTANPAGLPINESSTTTVTISAILGPGETPQSVTVPVSLTIGDVYTTHEYQWERVFLPLMVR